jgi:hypothetical protein
VLLYPTPETDGTPFNNDTIIIILDGNKTGDDDAMWSNNVRDNIIY